MPVSPGQAPLRPLPGLGGHGLGGLDHSPLEPPHSAPGDPVPSLSAPRRALSPAAQRVPFELRVRGTPSPSLPRARRAGPPPGRAGVTDSCHAVDRQVPPKNKARVSSVCFEWSAGQPARWAEPGRTPVGGSGPSRRAGEGTRHPDTSRGRPGEGPGLTGPQEAPGSGAAQAQQPGPSRSLDGGRTASRNSGGDQIGVKGRFILNVNRSRSPWAGSAVARGRGAQDINRAQLLLL